MTTKVKTGVIADQAVGTTQLANDAVNAAKIATDAVGSSEIAADAVGASEIAAGAIGTSEIADGSIATADLDPTARPAFTKSYTSPNQTITAAGALTLAHSLGAMPALVQTRLKCLTAEINYSVGDEVIIDNWGGNTGQCLTIVPDATNLNVRYGGDANVFALPNKTTGIITNITNANWAAIFKAWA